MGLASPRNIGIVAVIAVAAGLAPGVPGLVGGAPAEDAAAAALPPAPEIVEVETGDPVGPDDGLIRLIVTPAPSPAGAAAPSEDEQSAEPEPADDTRSGESAPPDPPADADAPADEGDGAAAGPRSGAPEHSRPDAADPTPQGSRTAGTADAETVIDPDVLSALTDGAVLRLDRRNRPWAVFGDATRVPLFPSGDGERRLAQRKAAAEAASARADADGDADADTVAEAEVGDPSPDPAAAAPRQMPADSVGHPMMDRIATLAGVSRIVALGDGTYAVTLEDPAVLDGLAVEVAEDVPMGIGSEPYEGYQWPLDNTGTNLDGSGANPVPAQRADADIDGVEARAGATGRGVVVAVIDSGVDFSHPDLARSRWINDDEECANGVDDDANGFVDDCNGWDFAYEDDSPFNRGAHPHGTHVAGIIAAAIDGQGIAGVAPDAEIMDLNVGTITASGQPGITMSAVARAIRYAADNGANVINLSLGTSPGSPREASAPVESAIRHAEANDVLVVAAAGNDGVSLDGGPGWPAGYEMSNMITVGASSPSDTRAGFSNWGRVVDIFAPGELILSTVPVAQGRWSFMSGTSQATPIVAATAALLLGDVAGLPPAEVRVRLIATSDRHDSLMPHVADGVRLNAAAAVGEGSPDHRLADVAVRIGGLSSAAVDVPVEADIDIAVPAGFGGDDAYSWHASVFVSLPDSVAAVTGHEVRIDGVAHQSDELGSVDLGIEGSGAVALTTRLPAGSYAVMLEAVPEDDPGQRLGAPKVVSFTVGSAETGAAGDGAQAPTSRSGASPTDLVDAAPGSDGSGGASDSPAGSPSSAGSGSSGDGSRESSGSTGAPPRGSNGGGGSSGGSSDIVGGGGSAGSLPSDTGGTSAGGSRPVTVDVGGGGGSGPGSSTPSASGAGRASGSSTAPTGPTLSEPPAPPAPVASGEWAIDVVSPYYGPVGTATTVQLIGRFPSSSYVWFGDRAGTVLVASDRMMVVLAPAQAAAGTVDISLRRTGEGTVLTQPGGFTYLAEPGSAAGGGAASTGGSTSAGGSGSSGDTGGGGSAGSNGGGIAPGEGGGGDAPGTGGGEQADPAEGAPSSARVDARQSRGRSGGEVVDLGNGLRGVILDGADPVAGARTCSSDPCRF